MPRNLIGKRVVLIEDEGMILMALRRILEKHRVIVSGVARDGQEGVEMVLQQRPDIVLTDINMPVMDGLEAARQILSQYPVCIILVSAYASTTDLSEIAKIGVHGYLGKPVNTNVLLSAMEEAYERFLQGKTFGV